MCASVCMGRFDKRGIVHASVCVFVCMGCQSHPACSQRVENDKRIHSRGRRACYADCNFHFFFVLSVLGKIKPRKANDK